jgi:hypothetical protein
MAVRVRGRADVVAEVEPSDERTARELLVARRTLGQCLNRLVHCVDDHRSAQRSGFLRALGVAYAGERFRSEDHHPKVGRRFIGIKGVLHDEETIAIVSSLECVGER